MNLDAETLRHIYEHPPFGDSWPYDTGSSEEVESHIKRLVADLNRSDLVAVSARYDSFRSGYASFVEVFCVRKDEWRRISRSDPTTALPGILMYISRHAPYAAIGSDRTPFNRRDSGFCFLGPQGLGALPEGDWRREYEEVVGILAGYGYEVVDQETMEHPLPFKARIETVFSEPPYHVWDVLFHWCD